MARNTEIGAGVADPDMRERLVAVGPEPHAMTTAEFDLFIADEIAK